MTDPLINAPVYGGYVITRQLGEGGMGTVYLAEDRELDKRIAVKVLLPQFSQHAEIVERFKNEAVAASALNHPHIIDILTRGQIDGRHWIAMQFLEGADLGAYLTQWERLAPAATLEILVQVCSALSAAHERQIVHRDLKPDNIFLTRAPVGWQWPNYETPFVKLLDFGIAKLGDPKLAGQVKTRTYQVIGTPLYMSMEQGRGSLSIDHRTDIYSLGVIVYEMLAGCLPYSGNSVGDIVVKQSESQARPLIDIVPDLPAGWNDAIMSALAPTPDHRPPTAHTFCKMLWSATPELTATARTLAPEFVDKASSDDETKKASGALSASMLARSGNPTTLTAAVGVAQSQPAPAESKSGWMRWGIAALLVVGLGVGGVLLAQSQGGDSDDTSRAAHQTRAKRAQPLFNPNVPAGTTPTPRSDTAPDKGKLDVNVPAAVDKKPSLNVVTIKSSPAGAMIQIGDKPARMGPVTAKLVAGQKITITATLAGYESKTKTVTVSVSAAQEFAVLLKRKRRRTRRTTEPRARPRPKKTAPAKSRPTKKPEAKPRVFDPHTPQG